MICEWKDASKFPLNFKREVKLEGYGDQNRPLCNPSSDLLCPWSAANFLWSEISLTKKYSLNQLQLSHNPLSQNLRQLDKTWSSLGRYFPLVVRVLAKCKEKLILQQDNHRKSWMCLTNLLVADNSAYSVVTVWDDAVGAVTGAVREGDILVLAGGYRPAMMQAVHRKLIHNIGPKVRLTVQRYGYYESTCR